MQISEHKNSLWLFVYFTITGFTSKQHIHKETEDKISRITMEVATTTKNFDTIAVGNDNGGGFKLFF